MDAAARIVRFVAHVCLRIIRFVLRVQRTVDRLVAFGDVLAQAVGVRHEIRAPARFRRRMEIEGEVDAVGVCGEIALDGRCLGSLFVRVVAIGIHHGGIVRNLMALIRHESFVAALFAHAPHGYAGHEQQPDVLAHGAQAFVRALGDHGHEPRQSEIALRFDDVNAGLDIDRPVVMRRRPFVGPDFIFAGCVPADHAARHILGITRAQRLVKMLDDLGVRPCDVGKAPAPAQYIGLLRNAPQFKRHSRFLLKVSRVSALPYRLSRSILESLRALR